MKKYDVAAYIWPAFSNAELRDRIFWEEGIGEWQTVQRCHLKDDEYEWKHRPLWGYQNEADPYVMTGQIEAAADHGVNVFIYDWYWYDGRPFLNQCLEEGFLKAKNNDKVKFYIMWANHNAGMGWDVRYPADGPNVSVWDASVDRTEFEKIAHIWIEKYFTHPSYYRIDNKPVLSIYNIGNLVNCLGSVAQTREAFAWLNAEAVKAGLDGVHLQIVLYGEDASDMSGFDGGKKLSGPELLAALGADSVTNYQYIHWMGVGITRDYREVSQAAVQYWNECAERYAMPYYPGISIGWDPSPRRMEKYPARACNNTPENFEEALRLAKAFLDKHGGNPLVVINSWNEWTETSYMQPDNLYGYGYLQAVKHVFKADK